MKLSAKLFIIIAVIAGIAYGSSAKDRTRWLAALGLSRAAATEIRIDNTRAKFHAARAEEQARWRSDDRAQPPEAAHDGLVVTLEDVCAGLAEKEALLRAQGKDVEAGLRRMKAVCSGDSAHLAD